MKKFFALAMAMCSMLAMMSSCSKDDAKEDDPEPEPVEVKLVVTLAAALTDVQQEFMDLDINYTIDETSASITPGKMKTMPCPMIEKFFETSTGKGKPTLYVYEIPGEFTAEQVLNGTVEFVVTDKKEGIDKYMNTTFNCFGRSRVFIKVVGEEELYKIDNPLNFEAMGEAHPSTESEFNQILDIYKGYGKKTHFELQPISK